jgi:hypothetical protein
MSRLVTVGDWFWPKIAAALTSKHHWLIINCDSGGTVIDLHLRVKPRDPEGFEMCNVHAAMDTVGHASLRRRDISFVWPEARHDEGSRKEPQGSEAAAL